MQTGFSEIPSADFREKRIRLFFPMHGNQIAEAACLCYSQQCNLICQNKNQNINFFFCKSLTSRHTNEVSPSSTPQPQFSSAKDKQLGQIRKLHPRGKTKQNNYTYFWTHPPQWGTLPLKKTMFTEETWLKPRTFDCLRVGRSWEVQT